MIKNIVVYLIWGTILGTFWYAIISPYQHNPYDEEICKKSCSTEIWSKDKCFSVCEEQYGKETYLK